MDAPNSGRRRRNVVFLSILVLLTALLIMTRLGSDREDFTGGPSGDITSSIPMPETAPSDPLDPRSPTPDRFTDAKPETATISFVEFVEQYDANAENFRARDSLAALIVDRQVQWEGYVRNVSKHPSSFYVSIWSAESYNGSSALITFDHSMEDELYALQPNDHVRFEGVVTRAAGSVGIEGLDIEVIE